MNPDFLFLSGYNSRGIKPTLSLSTLNSTGDGTTATFTGEILTGNLITESGFCWNTLPTPTINNFKQTEGPTVLGPLVLNITSNLSKSTTYFVRAYAINEGGVGYSNELYFTTLPTTVQIGNQVWNTKNEDRTTYRDGTEIPEFIGTSTEWYTLTTGAWVWYGKNATTTPDPSIGIIYGRLYNWYAVKGIWNEASLIDPTQRKEFAPAGYHVPTNTEYTALSTYVNSLPPVGNVGSKLKEVGNTHFAIGNTDATNITGFTALPAGYRGSSSFANLYYSPWFWTSTESTTTGAYSFRLENDLTTFVRNTNDWNAAFSVRLMEDLAPPGVSIYTATTGDNGTFANMTGAISGLGISVSGFCWSLESDPTTALTTKTINGGTVPGNINGVATLLSNDTLYYVRAYATNSTATVYSDNITFTTNPLKINIEEVKIGTQIWAKNNLDAVSYLGNGVPIPTEQYGYYGGDVGNGSIYGLLYTVNPARNTSLPSQGWRVPTNADFIWLRDEFFGETAAGGALKQAGDLTIGNGLWASPNSGATNSSGWTGLPGGTINQFGASSAKGLRGWFWTSSTSYSLYASFYLSNNGTTFTDTGAGGNQFFSIRLIRNIITLFNNPVTAITPTQISITTNMVPETRIAVLKDTGVCWSTSPDPTIANNRTINPIETTPIAPNPTVTIITNQITGLTENVNYYVRAYYTEAAIGAIEERTYYGFNNFFTAKLNTLTGVKIGNQIWQSANSNHVVYSDGTSIPEFVGTNAQWAAQTLGRWCYYNNDPTTEAVYGKLYNWQAVAGIWNTTSIVDTNQRKFFAPTGWRVPEVADFNELITSVGTTAYAGYKLKETGTATWAPIYSTFYNASNSSGFTGRGAGARTSTGFGGLKVSLYLWTYTQASGTTTPGYRLQSNSQGITATNYTKSNGMSVRLIKI